VLVVNETLEPATKLILTPLYLTLLITRSVWLVSSAAIPTMRIRFEPLPIVCDQLNVAEAVEPDAELELSKLIAPQVIEAQTAMTKKKKRTFVGLDVSSRIYFHSSGVVKQMCAAIPIQKGISHSLAGIVADLPSSVNSPAP
jgi:hypothetical protein